MWFCSLLPSILFGSALAGGGVPVSAQGAGRAAAHLPPTHVDPLPVPVPRLAGPTAELSGQGLTRERIAFEMHADLAALDHLDARRTQQLMAQLAADPRWRVGRTREGLVVAHLRPAREPESMDHSGYHRSADGCSRVALYAGRGAHGSEWDLSPQVTLVPAGAQSIELRGFHATDAGCSGWATALQVLGSVTLEVFESGDPTGRPHTVAVLGQVPAEVANLAASMGVAASAHDPFFLPPGEPVLGHGAPVLTVRALGRAVQVWGRANPGEAGWTWVRVVDRQGHPWEEHGVAVSTLERIGWSNDSEEGFYVQSAFGVPPDQGLDGRAELWFQPDGGTPRSLHAVPIRVPEQTAAAHPPRR